MDAADLLWGDAAPHQRRFDRSAAALIAVERALREDGDAPGTREFLALYASAASADPAHFARVWCDPVAYYWVRRAVHLLAARHGAPLTGLERAHVDGLGARDASETLRLHLRDFARFVLGLGVVGKRNVRLVEPYETALPLAIPGTELTLSGSGRIRIAGVVDGTLHVIDGESRLETCPVVAVGDARVVLNPHVFLLPGLSFGRQLSGYTLAFQREHADEVGDALELLRRFHPPAFAQFAAVIRTLAVKPVREEDFGTLSNSELPGTFLCSVPSDPLVLAADFIHELHHNRLFAVEEAGPFFETAGEDAVEGELHYSPWRDAPRPLHGLLHAVYVYLPVLRFWRAAWDDGALDAARRDHVRDQLARIPFQVRIGTNQLRRAARFTPLGAALFDEMTREATRMTEELAGTGIGLDSPAVTCRANGALRPVVDPRSGRPRTVAETLLDHLERFDRRGECREDAQLLREAVQRGGTPPPG